MLKRAQSVSAQNNNESTLATSEKQETHAGKWNDLIVQKGMKVTKHAI